MGKTHGEILVNIFGVFEKLFVKSPESRSTNPTIFLMVKFMIGFAYLVDPEVHLPCFWDLNSWMSPVSALPQEVFEKLQPYFDANRTCIGTIFAQGGGNRSVIWSKSV